MKINFSPEEQKIIQVIKTVIDPEVEVNIVDLGLIYDIKIDESAKTIFVLMTLSARGCPVGDTIVHHVETVVKANNKDYEVNVELTWEPEWTPELITEEGKKHLNM